MNIEVRLFANFREGRWKKKILSYEKEVTIEDILKELNIAYEETGIIFVNGSYREIKTVLNDGDILSIFPPVAGG